MGRNRCAPFDCRPCTRAERRESNRPTIYRRCTGCAITNAVACVPPQNRPNGEEASNCRPYLSAKLTSERTILALGKLAHDSVLKALKARVADHPFAHAAVTNVVPIRLVSSYHPSRYNVSTKRINAEMLDDAIGKCLMAPMPRVRRA